MANGNGKQNFVKPHILLIGLALVAFNSYWCLMGTEVWHSTQLTIASLFFNAVFTLLVFVLVNLLLQRFIPRLAMSQADLQTIYVMVVMVSTISGHTMMGYLIPSSRIHFSSQHPKMSGYRFLEIVSPIGLQLKARVS